VGVFFINKKKEQSMSYKGKAVFETSEGPLEVHFIYSDEMKFVGYELPDGRVTKGKSLNVPKKESSKKMAELQKRGYAVAATRHQSRHLPDGTLEADEVILTILDYKGSLGYKL
jgi:hypothetical protein